MFKYCVVIWWHNFKNNFDSIHHIFSPNSPCLHCEMMEKYAIFVYPILVIILNDLNG